MTKVMFTSWKEEKLRAKNFLTAYQTLMSFIIKRPSISFLTEFNKQLCSLRIFKFYFKLIFFFVFFSLKRKKAIIFFFVCFYEFILDQHKDFIENRHFFTPFLINLTSNKFIQFKIIRIKVGCLQKPRLLMTWIALRQSYP